MEYMLKVHGVRSVHRLHGVHTGCTSRLKGYTFNYLNLMYVLLEKKTQEMGIKKFRHGVKNSLKVE